MEAGILGARETGFYASCDAMVKNEPAPRPSHHVLPFEQPIEDVRRRLHELEDLATQTAHDLSEEIEFYRDRLQRLTREVYADLTPWHRVQVARHPQRPLTSDYMRHLFTDLVELHGDGYFGDDKAILTCLATLRGRRLLLIGHRKGRDTKDRLSCHFGSAHPEGYRKALRKMHLAERLGLPVVCLINTPGAYPGVGAEERGQARAIAENIFQMFRIRVPILVVVIGEGGSGGALGIAIGDRVAMLENSWYSVISPEGCASILWRSAERKEEAATALKLTAGDMHRLGLVDEVIAEPVGGAHRHPHEAMERVADRLEEWLDQFCAVPVDQLLEARYRKFRDIANLEASAQVAAQAAAELDQEASVHDPDAETAPEEHPAD